MLKSINQIVIALFALAVCAYGQASLTKTTLSAALDARQKTALLASATGVTLPSQPVSNAGIGTPTGNSVTILYVDQEAMVPMTATATTGGYIVQRGMYGTKAVAHLSGARVWVGPASYFSQTEPTGACTATTLTVLPRVVIPSGNVWNCGSTNAWNNFYQGVNGPNAIGAAIATATTIAPTNPVFHATGTTAIVNITVPPALPATGGCIVIIPDGIGSTTAAGNIALASTTAVGKALTECYDPGTSKWYPSY